MIDSDSTAADRQDFIPCAQPLQDQTVSENIDTARRSRWLEEAINYGEEYEKLPRVIPYVILPFSAALILLRVLQASWAVVTGRQASLIVSHEAEDAVAEAASSNRE